MDLLSQHLISETSLIDANYILDIVLDNIDQIMDHIPPNPSIDDDTDRCSTWYNDSVPSNKVSSDNTESSINLINSTNSTVSCGNNANFTRFKLEKNAKVELKDNIYISKDITTKLSQVIAAEDWGKDSILLYKYIDYIFRSQLFNNEIMQITHYKENGDKAEYLIFKTGLQRRSDDEFLFVLSTPNFALKPQKWRVQIGNFLSKHELLQKLKNINLLEHYLPERTTFSHSISDSLYNPQYSIDVNWTERLTTIQDRLYNIIGDQYKYLKLTQLIKAFDDALSTTKILITLNPKLAVPQGFVDSKRRKCRMELLLPLVVKFHAISYTFALAVSPSIQKPKTYSVKSILTLSMAYSNARLVDYVNSSWLIRN